MINQLASHTHLDWPFVSDLDFFVRTLGCTLLDMLRLVNCLSQPSFPPIFFAHELNPISYHH